MKAVQEVEGERDDDEGNQKRWSELVHRLGVVDHDAVDFVRDILERVGDALEMLVDFARHNELHRGLGMLPEGFLEAARVNVVRGPFQADDLLGDLVDAHAVAADVAKQRHRLGGEARCVQDHRDHLLRAQKS